MNTISWLDSNCARKPGVQAEEPVQKREAVHRIRKLYGYPWYFWRKIDIRRLKKSASSTKPATAITATTEKKKSELLQRSRKKLRRYVGPGKTVWQHRCFFGNKIRRKTVLNYCEKKMVVRRKLLVINSQRNA